MCLIIWAAGCFCPQNAVQAALMVGWWLWFKALSLVRTAVLQLPSPLLSWGRCGVEKQSQTSWVRALVWRSPWQLEPRLWWCVCVCLCVQYVCVCAHASVNEQSGQWEAECWGLRVWSQSSLYLYRFHFRDYWHWLFPGDHMGDSQGSAHRLSHRVFPLTRQQPHKDCGIRPVLTWTPTTP